MTIFLIVLSFIYLVSMAVVDGMFNRLIFREDRKLPYNSSQKQKIYKKWEWKVIGVLYLLVLPLIIPTTVAYIIGGWWYVLGYGIVFLVVQWDMIFGKIVFGSWTSDTPSIAIPIVGWIQVSLKRWLIIKLLVLIAIVALLI